MGTNIYHVHIKRKKWHSFNPRFIRKQEVFLGRFYQTAGLSPMSVLNPIWVKLSWYFLRFSILEDLRCDHKIFNVLSQDLVLTTQTEIFLLHLTISYHLVYEWKKQGCMYLIKENLCAGITMILKLFLSPNL